ncbi:DUF4127 family protein [Ruania alba]|uniref:F5/8 type C domain-containing protein n=1 Tax=Ruania alba TaxID=648782 RepID=A0A1H5NAC4_9MICO|nr:DUF4127 family protein [Ruania alba]SEE97618.1 F5/8 type C domain-containing protein [Ruania alba]
MRHLTALLTTASLLAASLTAAAPAHADRPATPPADAGPPTSLGDIAVVPLDDRPFPAMTPVEMAAIGGHSALTPETDLLGEFFDHGDADAVGDWWAATAPEADASVLALPMLAYGGLVASRTCATDLATARERLQVVEEVAAANPDQPIYAFDVIQRLTIAPTSGYPGMYSGPVRQWAELMDQVENLGREDLRAEYEEVAAEIPEEIKSDYLCARERNHQINQDMIHLAAAGTIDVLVLGQDDASEFGPHRAEKEALAALIAELGVEDRVKIYPGADVLGALLTAKLVVERLDVQPSVAVEWSRTPGEDWVAPYQDIPYADLVDEYIATLGAEHAPAAESDVLLMANTAGAGSLDPFVDRIHEAVARGRLVAVGDDAVAGVVDPELRNLLAPRIDLARLGGWSGWNVGISLSQAVVRAAFLEASRQAPLLAGDADTQGAPVLDARQALLLESATAHQRLLVQELVHTDLYRNHVRTAVRNYAVAEGDDPQHFTTAFEGANALATDRTAALATPWFAEEFTGTPVRLGSDGTTERTAVVASLDSLDLHLGWPRYQELDVFPEITLTEGEAAAPVAVAVLPASSEIRPETEVSLDLAAVLRNDTAATREVEVTVAAPQGWTTAEPSTVSLDPFEVRELAAEVTTAALAPEQPATVEVVVTPASGEPTSATSTVMAVWRNVALASNGATVAASGSWSRYTPDLAIDGNTTSTGSRWLTEATPPHWLEVTFAAPETIDAVQLHQYAGYLLHDYTISAEVDGQWQVVNEVTANSEVTPLHRFDPVEATAIRLDVTATADGRVRLYEVEVTCRSC